MINNILHIRHALTQQAWVTDQTNYIYQNSVSSFYYEFLARPSTPRLDKDALASPAPHHTAYHAGWGLIVLVWLLFVGSVTVLLFSIHYGSNIRIMEQLTKLWD